MSTPPEEVLPDERSNASSGPNDSQRAPNEQINELGPLFALFRVAAGNLLPQGPLGPDNVPISGMAIPIRLAIEDFVRHAKRCRNPYCPHVPMSLLIYRRMRPDAIRVTPGARERVHKTLWADGNHEFVRSVRNRILEAHPEVAEAISSGAFTTRNRLQELLDELGEDGPLVLAAVLWATELKSRDAQLLFRCVVALVENKQSVNIKRRKGAEEDDDAKLVRPKHHVVVRERDQAVQRSKQLARDLQLKEGALETTRRDLGDMQGKYKMATQQIEHFDRQLRDAERTSKDAKRNSERTTNTASSLRRDLHDQQRIRGELEAARADLALQLASERQTIERLKLELAAVPMGPAAVNSFLREEEERLDLARTITAGGDRVRADQDWTLYRKLKNAFLEAHPQYRQPAPVRVRPKTSARLVTLGGSAEVGRSCYLVELGKHRIMVDCGIKPSSFDDLHPELGQLDHLDALVLTHAHTDHIGWVPALVRRFPDISIYCSKETAALLPVVLDDCYQHYMRKLLVQRERAKYVSNATPVEELYSTDDVWTVPFHVINCSFNQEEGLPFGDASLMFYRAGHILGAASVLLQDSTGRRIFFSGDFSSFPQLTVGAAEWPDEIGEVDLLVLESTYGGREPHRPQENSRNELVSFIAKTIEGRGSVILASFGLGRAQELLKLIVTSRDTGDLPRVDVFVDGMIKRINPIYRRHASFDLPAESIREVTGETERQEIAISTQTHPSIIVTTSGMLTGGPVLHYARHLLPDPHHRIVLTGYQDEGAPSRVLTEVTSGQRIVTYQNEHGDEKKFEAAMPAKEVGLSAHADQPGLLEYAAKLRPRQIALVHGESQGQERLRQQLLKIHPKSDVICGPASLQLL